MPKQKCPEGVADWVLTFGDMMSLLLCFFIMLFAISTLEVVKAKAVAESLSKSFGNKKGKNFKFPSQQARAPVADVTVGGADVASPHGDNNRVMNIRDNAELVRGGVIRFAQNSDELSDAAKRDLDLVYQQLAGSPYKIEIRGHAGPEEKSIYHNYWDLAYTRALAVASYLKSKGMQERYFRISSAGPYEPIGSSASSAFANTREMNSTVEVMQLLDYVQDYEGEKADRQQLYINQIPL